MLEYAQRMRPVHALAQTLNDSLTLQQKLNELTLMAEASYPDRAVRVRDDINAMLNERV